MSPSGRLVASFAMGFRRLRAAGFFPSDGKETKGSPGADSPYQEETSRSDRGDRDRSHIRADEGAP